MREFRYVIKDEQGIHARPAGLFVKKLHPAKARSLSAKMEKKWMQKEF